MSEHDLHLRVHDLPAGRALIALWGGLAAIDATQSLSEPMVQLGAVTAVVAVCSLGVGRGAACVVAGIGWLLVNGFVVHGFGQLGFVGVGDVLRAVLLLGVALAATELRR